MSGAAAGAQARDRRTMAQRAPEKSEPRVAVIGSGLAGLSAAWLLSKEGGAVVHLYESAPAVGMGVHAVAVDPGGGASKFSVDIPPRFVVPPYYPEVSRLYELLGQEMFVANGGTSYSEVDGAGSVQPAFFGFGNWRLGGVSLPFLRAGSVLAASTILWDLFKFKLRSEAHLAELKRSGSADSTTFGEYIAMHYSALFCDTFAVPVLCTACTCSPEAIRAYPAEVMIEYWNAWALRGKGLRRARGGVAAIVARLSSPVEKLVLGTRVSALECCEGGVRVVVDGDAAATAVFDHVIIATQAHAAAELLRTLVQGSEWARENRKLGATLRALGSITCESSEMVLHTDERSMPTVRQAWAPMNIFVSRDRKQAMCTAHQSAIEQSFSDPGERVILQTWNPIVQLDSTRVIARTWFDRPVVTLQTKARIAAIQAGQGEGGVWLVGSYCVPGVPLLENAARSGLIVAEAIADVRRPWQQEPLEGEVEATPAQWAIRTDPAPDASSPFMPRVCLSLVAAAMIVLKMR